jgi:hypothetical protein
VGLLKVDCDCNCDAVFPVDATSGEVAKPFLRFVFLAVTLAIDETWTKQKERADQFRDARANIERTIELPTKSQAHRTAAPLTS